MSEPTWIRSGRIPSLDGLRAIAVCMVLLAHAHQTAGFPDIAVLHALGSVGHWGVDVFFVISGFLITTLLLRERERTGAISIKGFYWRRVLRIVPAYVCLLAAVAALQIAGAAYLRTIDWLAAMTYTVNFLRHPAWEIGHAWSLSIEEHFYLAWPLLFAWSIPWSRNIAAACLIICPLLRWVVLLAFPEWTPMAELWTFTRLDSIAAGCLLAQLAWNPATRQPLDRFAASWPAILGVLAVWVASLSLGRFSAKIDVGVAYSASAVCVALLAWAVMRRADSWPGRLLNWKPMAAIGVASYSLYLWQQLFLNHDRTDWICQWPQNLVFAVVAAIVSYRFVESPFIAIKNRS